MKYLIYGENFVKIGQVVPEIICLKRSIFLKNKGYTPTTLLNSRVNDTEVHQI